MVRASFITSLIFLFPFFSIAQTPEPIYSFARVCMPVEWYKGQSRAWQSEIQKSPKNAYAWYNYYRANRNLTRLDHSDTANEEAKYARLSKIVADMGKAVPNSFEYNFTKWTNGGNDTGLYPYLEKAASIDPERHELFSDMITVGELKGDMALRDLYAQKWFNSGEASPGMLNYNYNVIAGLKPDAILLTAGDNDTYPIWILQAAKGLRKDVTVLNISLLYIKSYRERIFRQLGIREQVGDLDKDPKRLWSETQRRQEEAVLQAIIDNSNHPVYVALTTDKAFIASEAAHFYLTGLAYEYSKTPLDNIAVLKKNFEQNYALDYLDKYFCSDISEQMVKHINANYIVPMVKLYEHYRLSGENQKAERIKQITLQLAKSSDDQKEIIEYLKNN